VTETIDPTFDLLDRRIALGGADDVVLTAPPARTPTLHGRPVTDPRLVEALSVPEDITRAEALDRTAKLGGVLRVLGADGATALVVEHAVPDPARTFAVLAGLRIGLEVVLQDAEAAVPLGAYGTETLTILAAPEGAAPADAGTGADAGAASRDAGARTGPTTASGLTVTVRRVRSHFEEIAVRGGGITRDLDAMMRDARIEPVAAKFADPGATALTLAGRTFTRAEAAEFAAGLLHD
jgi:hypothetical protein